MNAQSLIQYYQLQKHPEGGYFAETYRSAELISEQSLPNRFMGKRNIYTSIYFLIETGNFSAFHRIKSDEIWHFYQGSALEIFEIDETGKLSVTLLGSNIANNETFQYCVKAGRWFASRVTKGGTYSFVGCNVSPGFDFADFEMANREKLISEFPELSDVIKDLTR